MPTPAQHYIYVYIQVIKKSLCTWRLQLSQNTSFLPHYLAQSDCLAADRQGQRDTRLTLTPSFIPNSNYVIMVSDLNCLKYFCVFLYCNHRVQRDFLITLYIYIYLTCTWYIDIIQILNINTVYLCYTYFAIQVLALSLEIIELRCLFNTNMITNLPPSLYGVSSPK
jgi:hypothetical protein